MKIESLKINGFGKLENKEIELKEGINIIKGKNESGKSTLLKFITSMFYGTSKNKNGKTIPDYERYKPWTDAEYSGKITYTLDNGEKYEIFREFKKKSPIIYNEAKDDITKTYQIDKTKGNIFFIEQTGITEENFFATGVTEQESTKLTTNMKNEVIQKLSNIVSSGNENITHKKVIEKLNKSQLENIGTNRSTDRPINKIEEKIEKLENQKNEIETYNTVKYQIEEKKAIIKEQLEETKNILDLLRTQKINIEKQKPQKEHLQIQKNNLEEQKQRQEKLKQQINNTITHQSKKIDNNNLSYIISFLAMLIITVLSFVMQKHVCLIVNIIPMLIVVYLLIKTSKNKKQESKIRQNENQIRKELEKELEQIQNQYKQLENQIQKQEQENMQINKQAEEQINKQFKNKIKQDIIIDILKMKYETIIEYIDEKEREQTQMTIEEKTVEVENSNIVKQLENLVEIDEQLENLYNQKEELQKLNYIYEIVKEEIEKSYQEMKENITPNFIQELKNILKQVTNGKYDNVNIDSDNNIQIEIENGNYMPVEMLSIGTIDQIYLALRISAIKEITNESMPIILDESLAYYDDERMAKMLEYLNEQKEKQILIFTCSEREKDILEKEKIKYTEIEI